MPLLVEQTAPEMLEQVWAKIEPPPFTTARRFVELIEPQREDLLRRGVKSVLIYFGGTGGTIIQQNFAARALTESIFDYVLRQKAIVERTYTFKDLSQSQWMYHELTTSNSWTCGAWGHMELSEREFAHETAKRLYEGVVLREESKKNTKWVVVFEGSCPPYVCLDDALSEFDAIEKAREIQHGWADGLAGYAFRVEDLA